MCVYRKIYINSLIKISLSRLTMFPPKAKGHLRKTSTPGVSCFARLIWRVPIHTGYCYCYWLPLRNEGKP